MMNKLKNQSGFTLIELMISIGIFMIVVVGLYAFLLTSTKVSKSINDNARRENELCNTVEIIRTKLANAFDVQLVGVSELSTPEAGYTYLYCGPNGGLSIMYNGVTSDMFPYTSDSEEKILVTFNGADDALNDSHALSYNVRVYPVDKNNESASDPANLLLNDDGTYDDARNNYFSGTPFTPGRSTSYVAETKISFHNSNVVKVADSVHEGGAVLARVVKFKDPEALDILSLAPTLGTTTTTSATTTTSSSEPTTIDSASTTASAPETEPTTMSALDGEFYVNHSPNGSNSSTMNFWITIHNQTGESKSWSHTIDLPEGTIVTGVAAGGHDYTIDGSNVTVTSRVNAESGYSDTKVPVTISITAAVKKVTAKASTATDANGNIYGSILVKNEGTLDVTGEAWTCVVPTGGTVESFDGYSSGDTSKSGVNARIATTGVEYYGNATLAVGDSVTINIGTIKLAATPTPINVTVHFDSSNTVNVATGWTNMTAGFYGGVKSYESSNNSAFWLRNDQKTSANKTYSVPSGDILWIGIAASNSQTCGSPGQWSYDTLLSEGITDIYVSGLTVSKVPPSSTPTPEPSTEPTSEEEEPAGGTISVSMTYDSSGVEAYNFNYGEAVSGIYYLRTPEAHYNNWNYTNGTSFTLESDESVKIELRSNWSRVLASATYSYDQLAGKSIYINGSSISLQ